MLCASSLLVLMAGLLLAANAGRGGYEGPLCLGGIAIVYPTGVALLFAKRTWCCSPVSVMTNLSTNGPKPLVGPKIKTKIALIHEEIDLPPNRALRRHSRGRGLPAAINEEGAPAVSGTDAPGERGATTAGAAAITTLADADPTHAKPRP